MARFSLRTTALACAFLLITACGGGSSPAPVEPPPSPATGDGSLQVTVHGLPAGTAADIQVAGPDSYSSGLSGSRTLTGLLPGTYTLTAHRTGSSAVTPALQTISVASGKTATAHVVYAPALVNVKDPPYNAAGNGTDDTEAIQKAVDDMAQVGGIVFVPNGTYMIQAAYPPYYRFGIILRSDVTLSLEPGATLKAVPSASGSYSILYAESVSDIKILGGTLEGERSAHTGTGGEYGYGVDLHKGIQNALVAGVTAKECWGDGFFVGFAPTNKNIVLDNVVADHNRRQGLSVINVDGLVVQNSVFKNTAGIRPEAGIDLEPELDDTIRNVVIRNCTLSGNAGNGVMVPQNSHAGISITNLVLEENLISGNGKSALTPYTRSGLELANCSDVQVLRNVIQDSTGYGILLETGANRVTMAKNNILGNTWQGIYQYGCADNVITENTISRNGKDGILQNSCADATITLNTITGNGGHGILSVSCTGGTISGNTLSDNALP